MEILQIKLSDAKLQRLFLYSEFCDSLMRQLGYEFSQGDIKSYWLEKEGPCLPVAMGALLRRYKDEGKYLPQTYLGLLI